MQGAKILGGPAQPHQERLRAMTRPRAPSSSHPVVSGDGPERLFHGIERPVDVGVGVRERKVELRAREREDSASYALEREPRRLASVRRPEGALTREIGAA